MGFVSSPSATSFTSVPTFVVVAVGVHAVAVEVMVVNAAAVVVVAVVVVVVVVVVVGVVVVVVVVVIVVVVVVVGVSWQKYLGDLLSVSCFASSSCRWFVDGLGPPFPPSAQLAVRTRSSLPPTYAIVNHSNRIYKPNLFVESTSWVAETRLPHSQRN
jgi:hypothetical protein